ncbi:MAG: hypothetical protein KC646_03310 [Candidatus Cloacimonetes bacterium]|nr:hypothetical protein [Candidatus Cloacimonadota bacterium]
MNFLNCYKIAILFFLVFTTFCEDEINETLDLDLSNKGSKLFQSRPLASGKGFFLLKQVFPSSASGNAEKGDGIIYPSLLSDNSKYRLYGTMGQVITGSSEDSANFRMKAGFFTSNRKSVFKVRGVRVKRNPINIRR